MNTKLTLITVNGRSAFVQLPVVYNDRLVPGDTEAELVHDVKVRMSPQEMCAAVGVEYRVGNCICIGR